MHRLADKYGDMDGIADWSRVADVEPRVPALLEECVRQYANHELCVFDDERLTYGQADERSALLARQLLAAGVGKGTRIGMIFPNSPEFIITWLAIVRIGAVAVPMSTLATGAELVTIIRHADVQLLITVDRYLKHDYPAALEAELEGLPAVSRPYRLVQVPHLREVWVWGNDCPAWASPVDLSVASGVSADLLAAVEAQVSPADVVSIIYTSGSTAAPKGVIHTHNSFMLQAAKLAASFPYRNDDRVFTPLPFFWVGGLTFVVLNSMHTGSALLGSGKSGSALLDFLERERVTYLTGWPHLMRAIDSDPTFPDRDFSSMRGGSLVAALPAHRRPKNAAFGIALGMTETGGPHTVAAIDYPDELAGSLGTLMPGMEHKLLDVETRLPVVDGAVGELFVRGDALMQGFVKQVRESTFDADGWYRTGDLVSYREGHLFFHGRTDDMIKTSGTNVAPREVELALLALPGIEQAIVLSVPDPQRVNVVGAVVVRSTESRLVAEEIRTSLKATLSTYKIPRVIKIMEGKDVPVLSSTKIDRRLLVRQLSELSQQS